MSIVTPALTNFTAGEISPRLAGRVDLSKYYNGCETLLNFIVHPHGGATRRSGLRFVCEAANQDVASLLVPFEYNAEQSYVLEFSTDAEGQGLMRVFADRGRVLDPETGIQAALATPYEAEDLEGLKYVQSNDTLILTHPSHAPRKLTRTDHHLWTLEEIEFTGLPEKWTEGNWPSTACFFEERLVLAATPQQPNSLWFSRTGEYYDFRINTREVPLDDWDEMEVRSSANARDGRAGQTFVVLDGGRFENGSVVRGQNPEKEKRFFRYQGEVEFLPDGADLTVTFADTPSGNQVESVHTSEGELNGEFWKALAVGDRIENPEAGEPLADDGIEITLSAAQANAIEFLAPKARLWIGTSGGEWTVGGASSSEALSPSSIKAGQEGTCGSSSTRPESVASASLFIQRAGRKVREMRYNFDSDAYISRDLTILSEHITAPCLKQLAYAQEPDSLVWCLREDGVLLSLTYQPDQEVLAWGRHETEGQVERICTVYNGAALTDELWIIVRRKVAGVWKRFLEYLDPTFESGGTADAYFLDSGLTYDGEPLERLEGLAHLAGENISVLADGLVYSNVPVDAAGGVELERAASRVHAGLPYVSVLRPMRGEGGSQRGTAQTKTKRLTQVSVRFHNTLGGGIGPDQEHLEPIHYLTPSAPLGQALPLWTGDKKVKFPKGWSEDGLLTIVQSQPLPMTVLMVVPEVIINE
ncbi:MAG: hypothetical protein AB7E32_04150 [Desulfovibrio sp.]